MRKLVKSILTFSIIGILVCSLMTSCRKKKTPEVIPDDPPVETKTDITGVTFEDASFAYDGNAHSLSIGGTALPSGVSVTYTNNGKTEIGVYTVVASFSDTTGKYNVPNDMQAMLTIYDAAVYYNVSFMVDTTEVEKRSVKSGTVINDFPNIPSKNGYNSSWNYDGQEIIGNTVINAVYSTISYSIEYDLDGGVNNEANLDSFTVENNVTFANPTQTGCEFKGWYKDSDYQNQITTTEGIYENLKVYAKWERSTYNITYELNGGTQAPEAPETFVAGVTTTLPTPAYSGYRFAGWSTNANAGTLPEGSGIETTEGIYESIKLYAYWYEITYYITYDYGYVNDEKQPRMFTVSNDVLIDEGAVAGYDFYGWTSEDLGITTPQNTITIPAHTIASDIEIHGNVGNPLTYTITYDLNGGTTEESLVTSFTKDYAVAFPTNVIKEHYQFVGWYLLDSNGNPYVMIENTASVFDNITVKAIFEEKIHSITYMSNNLSYTNPNSSVTSFKESLVYTFLEPSAVGYEFIGWYSDISYENIITTTEGITSDLTVYAKFEEATYSIVYSLNGGTNNENNPTTYQYNSTVPIMEPVQGGYEFIGWTSAELQITTPQKALSIMAGNVTGDITLTANWDIVTYNVKYNDYSVTNSTFTVDDHTLKAVVVQDEGYEFKGWYTEAQGGGEHITTLDGVYHDITLYAYIPAIKYAITYELNGGTNNADNPLYYTVLDSNILVKDPTKAGYRFTGWTTTDIPSFTEAKKYPNVVIEPTLMTPITLTANWTLNEYNIMYYTDDCYEDYDDSVYEGVSTYREGEVVVFPALALNYYTFGGWYLDSLYTQQVTSTDGLTGNVELYGKTDPKNYTITYINSHDSSVYDTSTFTCSDERIEITDVPTLQGYTFEGYEYNGVIYSQINPETVCYIYIDFIDAGLPEDITITIPWNPN